jgi:hypothetical protein
MGRKVSRARLLGDIYETACTSAALPVSLGSYTIAMFRLVLKGTQPGSATQRH